MNRDCLTVISARKPFPQQQISDFQEVGRNLDILIQINHLTVNMAMLKNVSWCYEDMVEMMDEEDDPVMTVYAEIVKDVSCDGNVNTDYWLVSIYWPVNTW